MNLFSYIAPSKLVLLKVMALGIYFGWQGKKTFTPKVKEISNVKFGTIKEFGRLKL